MQYFSAYTISSLSSQSLCMFQIDHIESTALMYVPQEEKLLLPILSAGWYSALQGAGSSSATASTWECSPIAKPRD